MANITASMVKALRESTGAGMMDCKNALVEANGDMEGAVDWLRAKGLSQAAKKAGRIASEGLIGIALEGARGSVVEVNSETDFVARNPQFQEVVAQSAKLALATGDDVEALRAVDYPGAGKSLGDHLTALVGTIGENMSLRRVQCLSVETGVIAGYVHNAIAENLGRLGVLVALESTGDATKLAAFGRQLAMHIAATNPASVSTDDLDPEIVAREKAVLVEQARQSGRPPEIIEKMVEGRLRKYFEEVVLVSQTFVVDGENTVGKAVEIAAQDIDAPIKITGFVRFALGEGIEKSQVDFASEVAAVAGGG
ncbi:MAG: translation elongation factor Ts [Alphaproteobacteria bacterium]